ncbi:MAG: 50S ribosome-binding protein YggL [Desulfovermiculus sp.]
MKKRLRKKKRVGEFTEWGRQLAIHRNRQDGFDEFLDAFIEEAIEANGCYCGGGGNADTLSFVVELGCRSDDPDARMAEIEVWLGSRPDVKEWQIGPKFDLWHGDYQDIEERFEG